MQVGGSSPRDGSVGRRDREAARNFVLGAVRSYATASPHRVPAPPATAPWQDVAHEERVMGIVLHSLRTSGQPVPPEAAGFTLSTALRNLAMAEDLELLSGLLGSTGVRWAVLKGLVLNETVFRQPGIRRTSDLDVLIHARDIRRTVEALVERGATIRGADWSQPTWAQGAEVAIRLPGGTALDLHWHVINRPMTRSVSSISIDRLLDRATARDVGGVDARSLDDLDLVLHVLLHACYDGCSTLRALLDAQQCVAWLASRGHTPRELADRAAEHGLTSAAAAVLTATAHHLDPSVLPWLEALRGQTIYARVLQSIVRRQRSGRLDHALVSRAHRYIAPTTAGSLQAFGSYCSLLARHGGRLHRATRDEGVLPLDDVLFQAWLGRTEASTAGRSSGSC